MNEVYAEWLVKRKHRGYWYFVLPVAIIASALFLIFCLYYVPYVGWLLGLVPFFAIYFLYPYTKIEYEYIFVTGELTIDKIISQRRRKRVIALDMANIEMIADLSGHYLDGQMGNNHIKKYDFSSGEKDRKLFGVLCSVAGDTRVYIIEPSAKLIEAIKKTAPRKVMM